MNKLFTTILILFSINLFAQTSFSGAIYTGDAHSGASQFIETSIGEFLLPTSHSGHASTNAPKRLTKFGSQGNIIWQKIYGPCYLETNFYHIGELTNGNYFIGGQGQDLCLVDPMVIGYAGIFDTSGNVLWDSCLIDCNYDIMFLDMIADLNGGFVGILSVSSNLSLIKFDQTGNIVFQKNNVVSQGAIDKSVRIIQNSDGTFFICSNDFTPYIRHLTSTGDSISTFQIPDTLFPNETKYVRGFKFKDNKLITAIQHFDSTGISNAYFFETDTATYNTQSRMTSPLLTFIPLDNKNDIILSTCQNNFGEWNNMIEKRDSSNNVIWSRCFNPNYQMLGNILYINQSSDGGILYTCPIDSSGINHDESVYFIKLDSNGTVTNINGINNPFQFQLYPNPATDKLYVRSNDVRIKEFSILDISGKEIYFSDDFMNDEIDIRKLNAGSYFLRVTSYSEERQILRFVKQ